MTKTIKDAFLKLAGGGGIKVTLLSCIVFGGNGFTIERMNRLNMEMYYSHVLPIPAHIWKYYLVLRIARIR